MALANACPDSTTDEDCVEIVSSCNAAGDMASPIDAATCHDYVDGLSAEGRSQLITCTTMGQDACIFGIDSCAEGLGLL